MSPTILAGLAAVVALGVLAYGIKRMRARHLAETEAVRERLAVLQQLTLTLSNTLLLDDIVGEIASIIHGFVKADGVLVALAQQDSTSLRIVAADGSVAALFGSEIARSDPGLLGEALRENRVSVSHPEDDLPQELVQGCGASIAAVTPLETHGTIRGVLAAVRDGVQPFTSDDIRQLVTVATHTAMALAHASSVELLKRGKEQWEATFDVLATGIAVVDDTCRIRRANRTLADMLERPVTEVIGLDLCDELPGDSARLAEYIDAVRGGEEPPAFTHHSSPPERRFRISASRMRGATTLWVVVQIEDVTERRAIEEQLIQSEKMATVGQLVSGIAHDLNNPITSIAGVADLLVNRATTSPSDREHLEMIYEQAERASHIVRNLLTFARKEPVETSHAEVNDIAHRAAALINHEMKLRDVQFSLRLAEQPLIIEGNSHELQQVVLNLLNNAAQAVSENPEGRERQVTLSTSVGHEQVMLEVSDTGPGIDDKLLPQVFLPFVTTKPAGEGTGLGLSISYRIVQAHDGTIEARKRPGGGTTFVVSLPVLQIDDEKEKAAQSIAGASDDDASREMPLREGASLSILLLDQDPAVQRSLRASFANDGHSVDATRDASQAFSLLRCNRYDLIIADARATDATGTAFGDGLKSNHSELCSRTILMTADVRAETDDWLRSIGCRYLRKPFDITELRAAVRNLFAEDGAPEPG